MEASFLPSTFAYMKQRSCPRSASQVSPGSEHLTLLGGPVPYHLLTWPPSQLCGAAGQSLEMLALPCALEVFWAFSDSLWRHCMTGPPCVLSFLLPGPHFCFLPASWAVSHFYALRHSSSLCALPLPPHCVHYISCPTVCTASPAPSSEHPTFPFSLQSTSASPVSPKSR